MILDDIARAFRSAGWEFSNWIWPGAALVQMERERDWLKLKLRRGYDALLRQRNAVQSVTAQLAREERNVLALTHRVETYVQLDNGIKAYHHALELDQLRRRLERQRQQLDSMQQGYHDQVVDLTRLETRLADLEEAIHGRRLHAEAC